MGKSIKITRENVAKKVNEFNLENLTTSRACLIGLGWENIKIEESFYNASIDELVKIIGGREKTKNRIKFILRNTPLSSHWFSRRFIFEAKRNKWCYVAGQCEADEIPQIRKELLK